MERRNAEQRVEAVGRGDHRAFADLYREHIDAVVAFAVRRCRDPHEVAELCAATFVAVWEGAAGYDRTKGTPPAWIIGIASRRLADVRRADARRLRLSHRLTAEALLSGDDIERITERIDAERASGAALAAVGDLPPPQREVFQKVAVEGRNAADVGDELGISPTAVRMRLMRARQALRDDLESPDARTTRSTT
jgi:RNA polymerase sigma-70 factor (ECF subfamily)